MEVVTDFGDFHAWANARARALAMQVKPCVLTDMAPEWSLNRERLFRPDGAFFTVEGRHITHAAGREVHNWKQPLICRETRGYIALLSTVLTRPTTSVYLVRAKAEPGNRGIDVDGTNSRVLIAPSAQFSQGNLTNHEKALAGQLDPSGKPYKRVPFASLALPTLPAWAHMARWEDAPEDGGRFDQKVNQYACIPVTSAEALAEEIAMTGAADDFIWVNRQVMCDLRKCGMANGHLRSVLSLLV